MYFLMNLTSRTITGAIMMVLGLILIILPFILKEGGMIVFWIYGIPLFMIGLFILFNKKEDEIEQRRDMKGGKKR